MRRKEIDRDAHQAEAQDSRPERATARLLSISLVVRIGIFVCVRH
jgi:hypothetical protein